MKQLLIFIKISILFFTILGSQTISATIIFQDPIYNKTFETNFKERYSSDKYNYEGKKIVNTTPYNTGKYEDYKKEEIALKEKNNNESLSINLGPLSWLLYVLLAVAVIYLAYIFLNDGSSGLFSSRQNTKLEEYETITAENIEHTDITSLINAAENDNDYRLAIRYYYLLVLKTLSLKSLINYEDDKTNAEYLNELYETPINKKFEYTSYLYNYIWYGKFPVNYLKYNTAKGNFVELLNAIKS